jgi:hypothetical protein
MGLVSLAVFAAAEPDPKPPTLTIDEIREANVIGRLGTPLGEVVTIAARWEDPGKGYDRLLIREVNGVPFDPPIEFREDRPVRSGASPSGKAAKFEYGQDYRLRVYETAVFDGIRSEWFKETGEPIVQSHGFGLRSSVVVLRDITKTKSKATPK